MEIKQSIKLENFRQIVTKLPQDRINKLALSLNNCRDKETLNCKQLTTQKFEIASIYQNLEERALN